MISEKITLDDGLLHPFVIVYTQGQYEIYKKKVSKRLDKNNGKPTGETYERRIHVDRAQTIESAIEKVIRLRIHQKKVTALIDFYTNLKALRDETKKYFKVLKQTDEERFQKLENEVANLKSMLTIKYTNL